MAAANGNRLAIRWTIGDVSRRGFEALRLSLWGARRIFGPEAAYVVCVNTVGLAAAREWTGEVPREVVWRDVTNDVPMFIRAHVDGGMSEGVAWKFAPVRLFPNRYELSLDNDCILWNMPDALRRWLAGSDSSACVIAEDVVPCFGQFAAYCGSEPRNSGIRGVPPAFPLERALENLLRRTGSVLTSELDEQGLQVAALLRTGRPLVVRVREVSICSPFPPHVPMLGECGAHFVGLNARRLPWSLNGRSAVSYIREHWQRNRAEVYRRVGVPAPRAMKSDHWSARKT